MSASTAFKGPLPKAQKAELESIADVLQVSKEGNKPTLLTRIQSHFKEHPELTASTPRLLNSLMLGLAGLNHSYGK
jgi:hypothetical protein